MPSPVSAEPLVHVEGAPPPPTGTRSRTRRYERPILAGIATVAALLFFWGIWHSAYHSFYASAVRSMTDNPVAFFYGSFDPGDSITLDKLPGFLWPQALSALVLGFHPWSLVVPQALEGVASVVLLHVVVRRWAGVPAGLLAAAFLTLTPVTVGLGRSVTEDAPFVLLLLLAAEATQRATAHARSRTLVLAGVWVGVAFQCKMLEAWAVLPALTVTYLVSAPTTLRRRLRDLAAAGAVMLTVSLSWMLAAGLTPAAARPYLDGTTDNSPVALVVGYNFLTRFQALGVDAAGTGSIVADRAHSRASAGMGDSVWKMFSPGLASQTGWLYPLAALGLAAGVYGLWRRRPPRTDPFLAGLLLWGGWLVTFFLVFSLGSVTGHTYYMGVVAVGLSALAAVAVTRVRRRGVLCAVLAVNVGWCAALTLYYPGFFTWSVVVAVVLALPALALFAVGGSRPRRTALAVALVAVLVVPAVWSASAMSLRYNQPGGFGRIGPGSIATRNGASALNPAQRRVLAYLTAHRDGARYLAAVPRWQMAAPYILSDNAAILPIGGFTAHVPYPAPSAFHRLVDTGRLRYVLLSAADLTPRARGVKTPGRALVRWALGHCTPVHVSHYVLYRCGPAARKAG
ncbi:ArnT family glycosyltransferase [Streptomyces arenae]|uniref:ArnT family glycosyltransferase n=1 Tax=Streptomyces arenae TaxID=29301 RepID=UPI0026583DA1|nr:glycosyltransferase family 39 protein [Streptomyces arenae]MCG7202420.1 glycosyltransferase family 39 protein [Streptomyces arenae]